jgi:hypothetical protein
MAKRPMIYRFGKIRLMPPHGQSWADFIITVLIVLGSLAGVILAIKYRDPDPPDDSTD